MVHWKDLVIKYIDYASGSCRYPLRMAGRTALDKLSGPGGLFRVLVFAAHPDDETLGAGILLHRLHCLGADLRIVFTTNGRGMGWSHPTQQQATSRLRLRESQSALKTLGIPADSVNMLGFPDRGLHRYLPSAWNDISQLLNQVRPHFVLTHGLEGGHRDHDVTSLVVQLAATAQDVSVLEWAEYSRDYPLSCPVIGFPKLGAANPSFNLIMTDEEWRLKASALQAYQSQSESRYTARRQEVFRWANPLETMRILEACCEEPRVRQVLRQFGASKLANFKV